MGKLLERVQSILVIVVLSAGAARLLSLFQKDGTGSVGSFIDMLAISTPKRKPADLVKLLNSEQFGQMELIERVGLIQEMALALVRPGMNFEETVHVRGAFITAAINIIASLSTPA